MAEWIKARISELGTVVGGATPSTADESNYAGGTIGWITPKDLANYDYRYISHGERNITQKGLRSCSAQLLPPNSILFTSRAPIGYVAIAAHEVATNQGFKNIIPNESVDVLFLYYYLKFARPYLEQQAGGTTFKEISGSIMNGITLNIPKEKGYQQAVSKVLDVIDSKIEANKAINDNLEQQLRTIYDYWFTQFDFPDENGNPYRSSGGKMVWNDALKREIPEGWNVVPILDYVTWESNSQPPKSEFSYVPKEGYIRFIQNRDYDSDGYMTYIPYKRSLSIVDRFDILMDKYGDAGAIRYGIAGAFNVALGKIAVRNTIMQEYIRSWLSSAPIYSYLHNACMASTRASLNESNLALLKMPLPTKSVLVKYQEIAHQTRALILKNADENRYCITLRDWLLPMLMNGQVSIAN